MKFQRLSYSDFNNNLYSLTGLDLRYAPVQPHESSSGLYSGGQDKKLSIAPEQASKIFEVAEVIFNTKTLHRDQRRMLTAILRLHSEEGSTKMIIGRSEDQRKLEGLLKAALIF